MVTSRAEADNQKDVGSTSAKILNAATQAILSSGAGGLRVDAVASAAGVNKRMIYHYYGDKQGLIDAVYGLAARHVLSERNLLRRESRKILRALIVPLLVGNPAPGPAVSTQELQQAVKLLLPVLINHVPASAVALHITAPQWQVFALDVISLVFPGLASEVIAAPPLVSTVDNVSEDLLTRKKPRYRLASASRRV